MTSPTPEINVPLIQKVLQRIADTPQTWSQSTWGTQTECGTSHCFAGWTVMLTPGAELIWDRSDGAKELTEQVIALDGRTRLIPTYAGELLGMTYEEYRTVFYYFGDDFSVLLARVNQVLAGRGLPLLPAPVPNSQFTLALAGGPR